MHLLQPGNVPGDGATCLKRAQPGCGRGASSTRPDPTPSALSRARPAFQSPPSVLVALRPAATKVSPLPQGPRKIRPAFVSLTHQPHFPHEATKAGEVSHSPRSREQLEALRPLTPHADPTLSPHLRRGPRCAAWAGRRARPPGRRETRAAFPQALPSLTCHLLRAWARTWVSPPRAAGPGPHLRRSGRRAPAGSPRSSCSGRSPACSRTCGCTGARSSAGTR